MAGTNGKGSTIAMIRAALESKGYLVHVYTSPHLIDFNERIKINDIPSSDQQIIQSIKKVDKIKKKTRLTYFDYATLSAFDIFSKEDGFKDVNSSIFGPKGKLVLPVMTI